MSAVGACSLSFSFYPKSSISSSKSTRLAVTICDGICDSADRCGIESCEFYDTSPEGTRRFLKALYHEQTAEFQFAKPN